MKRITLFLVVLAACLAIAPIQAQYITALDFPTADEITPAHPPYTADHCDLNHEGSKAHAGFAWHTPTGLIQTAWWNEKTLYPGQSASKSISSNKYWIVVTIWQHVQGGTHIKLAEKACSAG